MDGIPCFGELKGLKEDSVYSVSTIGSVELRYSRTPRNFGL